MTALVTGGAGFIGSHIVDALIEKGHSVVIVDDFSTGKRENCHEQAIIEECSIVGETVEDVFLRHKPEVVIHCAAQMNVRRSVQDPVFDATVNILGTIRLLELSARYGIQRFVFCSSGGAIYGDAQVLPTPETYPCTPVSPYGISKLAGEHYLRYYGESRGITTTALRFGNVYGPRQRWDGEAGVVAIFISKILEGVTPTINGDGKQTRDYIYVDDVVNGCVSVLDRRASGVYNIGTGREIDVNTIYDAVRAATQFDMSPVYGPQKPGEQRRSCIDPSKARETFEWSPAMPLEEGVITTVQWFKEHLRKVN